MCRPIAILWEYMFIGRLYNEVILHAQFAKCNLPQLQIAQGDSKHPSIYMTSSNV